MKKENANINNNIEKKRKEKEKFQYGKGMESIMIIAGNKTTTQRNKKSE